MIFGKDNWTGQDGQRQKLYIDIIPGAGLKLQNMKLYIGPHL